MMLFQMKICFPYPLMYLSLHMQQIIWFQENSQGIWHQGKAENCSAQQKNFLDKWVSLLYKTWLGDPTMCSWWWNLPNYVNLSWWTMWRTLCIQMTRPQYFRLGYYWPTYLNMSESMSEGMIATKEWGSHCSQMKCHFKLNLLWNHLIIGHYTLLVPSNLNPSRNHTF